MTGVPGAVSRPQPPEPAVAAAARTTLPAYAVFAGMLSVAGLPIYIHAPKYYVDTHGVSLAALGLTLFVLRLVDVVQDPALGWLAGRLRRSRGRAVAGAGVAMALAMAGLFAMPPPMPPLLWFAMTLLVLFSAYSFLTIVFYAQGVSTAGAFGPGGHLRLATWRETGALVGVCLAAVAPTALAQVTGFPFSVFAAGFAVIVVLALWGMRAEWTAPVIRQPSGFGVVLADPLARRLLLIGLVNAAPVAVTSTLFLFFVESRLDRPEWAGALLLLFFLSAALAAPFWARLAARVGPKTSLLAGMALSVLAFGFAARLGTGDLWAFAVICLASGAALGADLTLLPAMFAARMARTAPEAGIGFGLWSFATKFSLAVAAATLLPALQAGGFVASGTNDPDALRLLTLLYAVVPCALKLLAAALLAATDVRRD